MKVDSYRYLIFFAIIGSLIVFVAHLKGDRNEPVKPFANQPAPFLKIEIRKKIDILYLKHDIASPACREDLLEFYYYQNSDNVLYGDAPYLEMTSEVIENIAQKHGCPTSGLAAIVSDYETWVLVEEQHYRNEDPGVLGADMDHDEF